jgi:hypothetical protein
LQLGRAILPSLQGNTLELDKWISRAARLRSLFPTAQRGSETIAISEFLAGQTNSIRRRFNIPDNVIEEAASKFSDLGQQLDFILEKRGATEEAAVGMANAFVGVRNELTLLLAQGFTPLFQMLQPVLARFREFLTAMRESQPGFLAAGAGFTALVAAGVPALLLFNQLAVAAEKLKTLGVLGGLGRLGVLGGAAAIGVGAGIGVSNAIGNATGNKSMQEASLQSVWLLLRQTIVILAKGLSDVDLAIRSGLVNALRTLVNAVIGAASSLGGVVSAIGGMLPGRMGGNTLTQLGGELSNRGAGALASSNAAFDAMIADITKRNRDTLRSFRDFMVPPTAGVGSTDTTPVNLAGGTPDISGPVQEWAKGVQRIEREAGAARLQAVRDHEQQRNETIAQYNLSALREAEDFARQRARAEANFQRQLADVQDAATKRAAEWQRERDEHLADLRTESAERLRDIDEEYAKDREHRARDHRERLLDAAARLDAVAVREEQRRFAQQNSDAADAYQTRVSQERENLAERIADEEKGHERRLEAQRVADAERLADLKRAFEEQRAEEDFERAIRLQRQAEDHASQLAQMDAAQVERLAQIGQQAAQERAALEENFLQQLQAAGVYRQAWLDQQKAQQEASLKSFASFWEGMKAMYPDAPQGPRFPTSWSDFGIGGNTPIGPQPAASGVTASTRNVTIAEGAIVVNAAAGQDERMIAREVRTQFERFLMEAI